MTKSIRIILLDVMQNLIHPKKNKLPCLPDIHPLCGKVAKSKAYFIWTLELRPMPRIIQPKLRKG